MKQENEAPRSNHFSTKLYRPRPWRQVGAKPGGKKAAEYVAYSITATTISVYIVGSRVCDTASFTIVPNCFHGQCQYRSNNGRLDEVSTEIDPSDMQLHGLLFVSTNSICWKVTQRSLQIGSTVM